MSFLWNHNILWSLSNTLFSISHFSSLLLYLKSAQSLINLWGLSFSMIVWDSTSIQLQLHNTNKLCAFCVFKNNVDFWSIIFSLKDRCTNRVIFNRGFIRSTFSWAWRLNYWLIQRFTARYHSFRWFYNHLLSWCLCLHIRNKWFLIHKGSRSRLWWKITHRWRHFSLIVF